MTSHPDNVDVAAGGAGTQKCKAPPPLVLTESQMENLKALIQFQQKQKELAQQTDNTQQVNDSSPNSHFVASHSKSSELEQTNNTQANILDQVMRFVVTVPDVKTSNIMESQIYKEGQHESQLSSPSISFKMSPRLSPAQNVNVFGNIQTSPVRWSNDFILNPGVEYANISPSSISQNERNSPTCSVSPMPNTSLTFNEIPLGVDWASHSNEFDSAAVSAASFTRLTGFYNHSNNGTFDHTGLTTSGRQLSKMNDSVTHYENSDVASCACSSAPSISHTPLDVGYCAQRTSNPLILGVGRRSFEFNTVSDNGIPPPSSQQLTPELECISTLRHPELSIRDNFILNPTESDLNKFAAESNVDRYQRPSSEARSPFPWESRLAATKTLPFINNCSFVASQEEAEASNKEKEYNEKNTSLQDAERDFSVANIGNTSDGCHTPPFTGQSTPPYKPSVYEKDDNNATLVSFVDYAIQKLRKEDKNCNANEESDGTKSIHMENSYNSIKGQVTPTTSAVFKVTKTNVNVSDSYSASVESADKKQSADVSQALEKCSDDEVNSIIDNILSLIQPCETNLNNVIVSGKTKSRSNLYVSGLPANATDKDLCNLFSKYGSIESSSVRINVKTGVSRCYGFVKYQETSHTIPKGASGGWINWNAQLAMEALNGAEVVVAVYNNGEDDNDEKKGRRKRELKIIKSSEEAEKRSNAVRAMLARFGETIPVPSPVEEKEYSCIGTSSVLQIVHAQSEADYDLGHLLPKVFARNFPGCINKTDCMSLFTKFPGFIECTYQRSTEYSDKYIKGTNISELSKNNNFENSETVTVPDPLVKPLPLNIQFQMINIKLNSLLEKQLKPAVFYNAYVTYDTVEHAIEAAKGIHGTFPFSDVITGTTHSEIKITRPELTSTNPGVPICSNKYGIHHVAAVELREWQREKRLVQLLCKKVHKVENELNEKKSDGDTQLINDKMPTKKIAIKDLMNDFFKFIDFDDEMHEGEIEDFRDTKLSEEDVEPVPILAKVAEDEDARRNRMLRKGTTKKNYMSGKKAGGHFQKTNANGNRNNNTNRNIYGNSNPLQISASREGVMYGDPNMTMQWPYYNQQTPPVFLGRDTRYDAGGYNPESKMLPPYNPVPFSNTNGCGMQPNMNQGFMPIRSSQYYCNSEPQSMYEGSLNNHLVDETVYVQHGQGYY